MKYYCGECFEEIGNCQPGCSEAARERNARNTHVEIEGRPERPACPHLQARRVVNGVFCLTCGKKLYD